MVNQIEFIAEIGINHNGSLDLAKKHIEKAKESGATIAKFQTYFTETRTKKNSPIYEILKKSELKEDDFFQIKDFCDEVDIEFSSTPFCIKSAELLFKMNCNTVKIASFHLSNLELLKYIIQNSNARRILVSTGVSSIPEVLIANETYDLINISNKPRLEFMHCISKYPVKNNSDNHLSNIPFLAKLTSKKVGFSDHSLGSKSAIIATALGATVIEKHFTIDKYLEGADHSMSAEPSVFKNLVDECKATLEMLGDLRSDKPFDCEKEIMQYRVETN